MFIKLLAVVVMVLPACALSQTESVHSLHQQIFGANVSLPPASNDAKSDGGPGASTPGLLAVQPRPGGLPGPCKTIFGYLPYWEIAANIRWNLLTHLACFSVDL